MGQRLFVEGKNDAIVIAEFWQACNLRAVKGHEERRQFETEFMKVAGGIDPLKKQLRLTFKGDLTDITSIGIIVDADDNPTAKWQAIRDILKLAKYTHLPNSLPAAGMVLKQTNLPTIGFWMMPDNLQSGYLEHFFYELIKVDDDLKPPVIQAIQSLYGQNLVKFPDVKKQKAVVYTWLSWQEKPGSSMGDIIKKKRDHLDFLQPTAQAFLAWSKQVFQFTEAE